ncbi:hypothetical protein FRC01_007279 [Tulasnella sp. 417]|nr:hypothetical protein FRC01_007279 [Tulasnella sp. 417]
MRLGIASLLILSAVALVTADDIYLNPPLDTFKPHPITSPVGAAKPIVGRMTNAKRLAMNLPPLKPKVLKRGTPAASAPRSGHSQLPPCPPVWNEFGEYGIVQENQAGALKVTFTASPDGPSDTLDFVADNGPSTSYPYLGGVVGFASTSDNLGPGSYNYAYVAGTEHIPSRTPQATDQNDPNNSFSATTGIAASAEGAIWKYDPTTQDITAQWINTDGSASATYLVYANDFNQAFILTGDVEVFQGAFGVPYPPITFTCIPPLTPERQRE